MDALPPPPACTGACVWRLKTVPPPVCTGACVWRLKTLPRGQHACPPPAAPLAGLHLGRARPGRRVGGRGCQAAARAGYLQVCVEARGRGGWGGRGGTGGAGGDAGGWAGRGWQGGKLKIHVPKVVVQG
jgi:hypothetical protein